MFMTGFLDITRLFFSLNRMNFTAYQNLRTYSERDSIILGVYIVANMFPDFELRKTNFFFLKQASKDPSQFALKESVA